MLLNLLVDTVITYQVWQNLLNYSHAHYKVRARFSVVKWYCISNQKLHG